MDITYLGHSAFRIKSKNTTIVMDPFDASVGFKFPNMSANIVTVSHNHADHNNVGAINDVKKVLSGPGEYEIMDVSFIGLASYHDDQEGEDRGGNTVFVVEAEGLRLVHFGDLGHILSERFYERLGDIDIALIPVGGFYTIDAQVATDIIKSLEPTITIPMHYQASGLDPKVFEKLESVEKFTSTLSQTVVADTKLNVTVSNIGEEQKVVVLARKS